VPPGFPVRCEETTAKEITMTDEEAQSLSDYWGEVDLALMKLYGVHTGHIELELEIIAGAQDEGDTPEQLALWCAGQFNLTPVSGRAK
jgi:hypothetical protein